MATNTAPSFGIGDGIVTTDFGVGNDYGQGVALQADGKIVVTGYSWNGSSYNLALTRYNADGSLDTTFDGDGKATPAIGSGGTYIEGVALQSGGWIQSDGKILVAGNSWNGSNYDFALVRYNSDGSLDTTFSGDGMVTTGFAASSSDTGMVVVQQPDGKIIVAGTSLTSPTSVALARYNADGSLDTTFSGDGLVTTSFGYNSGGNSVALQPDGKIVVSGNVWNGSNIDFTLVRYNQDGSLDTTFSGDGVATLGIGPSHDHFWDVKIQSDGKIVAAGWSWNGSNYDFALVRYNADGNLDTTFSGDGVVTTDFHGTIDQGTTVALQPDGKIVVGGYSVNGANFDLALARYNSDGSLDTTFDGDGKVTTAIGMRIDSTYDPASANYYHYGPQIALQPDGKIVFAGYSYPGSNADFAAVRYNADGSLDTTFGDYALNGTPIFTEGGPAVVLDSDVTIVDAELQAAGSYAGATLTLARQGGANAEDLFGATGSLAPLAEGGNLVLSGVTVGTVTQNSAGTLELTFGANATEANVNDVMRSITYTNASDTPPDAITIAWSFSDGNTGAQGDGGALAATGTTMVTITAANNAPVIISNGGGDTASISVPENTTAVTTVTATDADSAPLTYTIAGGADAALFTINANTGALAFKTAPDFEAPADAGHDNIYDVTVQVSDGVLADAQLITVSVTDVLGITPPPSDATVITGTNEQDVLTGLGGANTLYGLAGDDILDGGAGDDGLSGGDGVDTLLGGAGNDGLDVGTGVSTVDGGDGTDRAYYYYTAATTDLTVTYSDPANGTISDGSTVKNIEGVNFGSGSGNDVLNFAATTWNNIIDGGAGDDVITSGSANYDLVYGRGAMTLSTAAPVTTAITIPMAAPSRDFTAATATTQFTGRAATMPSTARPVMISSMAETAMTACPGAMGSTPCWAGPATTVSMSAPASAR